MKKLALIEKLYVYGLVVIFGLIVVHAPLTVFVGTHFGGGLLVKSWKELLMGGLLVLAFVIAGRRHVVRTFLKDKFLLACLALAFVYAVMIRAGTGFAPYAAGLLIDVRYILYVVLVYIAVRLFPANRWLFVVTGIVGAGIVIGFGLLQFVLPKDFLSVLGYSPDTITPYTTIDSDESLPRLQSTLRGPNPLGAYALIVALIAGAYAVGAKVPSRARRIAGMTAVVALIVLAGAYSRSAYIGVAVGAVVIGAMTLGRKRLMTRRVIVGTFIGLVVVIGGLIAIRDTPFYASVIEHDVTGSGPATDSNAGHSASLIEGVKRLATHPLGYGTGSTGSASLLGTDKYIVENQYLYVAHEAGWVALGLFLFIVGFLLKRAYERRRDPLALGVFASGVGLLIVGLLLPVFADDTVSIVWFGLAALVAGGKTRER